MKTPFLPAVTLLTGLVMTFPLAAQSPSSAQSALPPTSGSVTSNLYTNDYFGFSYRFPEGWSVQGEETQRRIEEAGQAVVAGADPNKRAAAQAALQHTYQLLTVFEYPVGSPVPRNSSILVAAEDVSSDPDIQTGNDYLFRLTQVMQGASGPVEVLMLEPVEQSFGGAQFFRADFKLGTGPSTSYQAFIVTIRNGFALGWIFTTDSPERLDELCRTMESVTFR